MCILRNKNKYVYHVYAIVSNFEPFCKLIILIIVYTFSDATIQGRNSEEIQRKEKKTTTHFKKRKEQEKERNTYR